MYTYTLSFREREAKKGTKTLRQVEDLKNGKESADFSRKFFVIAEKIRKRKLDEAPSLLTGKANLMLKVSNYELILSQLS
jgi:hypothetical protein